MVMKENKNHYETLRVERDASDDEIKSAYKKLAKIYHPDVYKGDKEIAQEKMTAINIAYKVLCDNAKREAYDYSLWVDDKANAEKAYKERYDDYATRNSRNNPRNPTYGKNKTPDKTTGNQNKVDEMWEKVFNEYRGNKKHKNNKNSYERYGFLDLFMLLIVSIEKIIYHPAVTKTVVRFFKTLWKFKATILFFIVIIILIVIIWQSHIADFLKLLNP